MQEQHFDVFLSHNNKDKALVHEISERLYDTGIVAWLDALDIPSGSDWKTEIMSALDTCDVFAAFLGAHGWSRYHKEETLIAIERQKRSPSYRIIPILLPGAKEEDFDEVENLFIKTQWVDFRGGIDNDDAF